MAEDLHRRLDDVFGALDQHDPQSSIPSWSISDRVVQNRGQEPPDSESEDEQEHRECIQVLRDVEEEEGDGLGPEQLPSSSACRAFEKEEEEDEFDRLACESLQKLRCRPKPALKTQVAEKNIYDRMISTLTSPRSPTSPTSPQAQPRSERKKVRFRETNDFPEDSPAATTQTPGAQSHCTTPLQGPSPRVRRRLLDGEAAVPASPSSHTAVNALSSLPSWQSTMPQASPQHQPRSTKSKKNRRSYVPEHVRRPDAFICYALDCPVVVGSGNDGHSASSAASAASAAAEYFNASNAAAAPASLATAGDPEPGSVQFVFRASRQEGKSSDACQVVCGDDGCPDTAGARPGHVQAATRAVAGIDSDMEDAYDGMDAAEAVQSAGGPSPLDCGGGVPPAEQVVPMAGSANGVPPPSESKGDLFLDKSGRRGGRKLRARTTDDD